MQNENAEQIDIKPFLNLDVICSAASCRTQNTWGEEKAMLKF
jgi:hypothetical protein